MLTSEEGLKKHEVYLTVFRWGQFLEFTLYHLFYFAILGPLCIFIFWLTSGITIIHNMQFLGINRVVLI
jgi:hypothetical protein